MNTKQKGNRLERRTMKVLEAQGYTCTRAAASLGDWDVVAIGPHDIKLIQVKANRRPGSVEMEKLLLFRCPRGCSKEIWVWKDRARFPNVEVL